MTKTRKEANSVTGGSSGKQGPPAIKIEKTGGRHNLSHAEMRRNAQAASRKQTDRLQELYGQDKEQIILELSMHQIELAMQNEKLRRAQADLEESRNKYVDLYDFAPAGYFSLNPKGIITSVNLTGSAMLGATKKELLQKTFSLFVHEDDADAFPLHFSRTIQEEAGQVIRIKLRRKNGTLLHCQLDSVAFRDDAGSVYEIRTAVTDITEHIASEETIRQLARFPAENPNPVMRLNRDGVLLYANRASTPLLGF